ncbi:DDN1 protein, partial [Serilophus lunatus]|nr:DDN1 protein [Serilophus lunatus]
LLLPSAFLFLPWARAGRIIGGKEVKPHSRPYMAYLEIKSGSGTTYWCGGFLIRPDAVLSAAHCVHGKGIMSITVTLGAHNISYHEPSQQICVGYWVIHPNYSDYRYGNDIMLLKLEPKAKITEYVKPISLPSHNEHLIPGTRCEASGWGRISVTRGQTDVMREVDLEVQCKEVCEWSLKNYRHQSMICAGDRDSRKSTYHGDSGGPLVCNGKAHGIVSYGPQKRLFPDVFTRISYFEPWIKEQLKKF